MLKRIEVKLTLLVQEIGFDVKLILIIRDSLNNKKSA